MKFLMNSTCGVQIFSQGCRATFTEPLLSVPDQPQRINNTLFMHTVSGAFVLKHSCSDGCSDASV